MLIFNKLKEKWLSEEAILGVKANNSDIVEFENKHNVLLPRDLNDYFKLLNGTDNNCIKYLYVFYSIERIRNIREEFIDWDGIPNYKMLYSKLSNYNNLFVLSSYNFNLFVYAIYLYPNHNENNDVLVFYGDKYKKIANSFSEFIQLYLNNSNKMQL